MHIELAPKYDDSIESEEKISTQPEHECIFFFVDEPKAYFRLGVVIIDNKDRLTAWDKGKDT